MKSNIKTITTSKFKKIFFDVPIKIFALSTLGILVGLYDFNFWHDFLKLLLKIRYHISFLEIFISIGIWKQNICHP